MKAAKRIGIGAGSILVLLALLLVLPFFLPTGRLIPVAERLASEQLLEPVRIASIQLRFLPWPHLAVGGIEIGKKTFLRVENVRVTPRLASLFDDQKVIRNISVEGVTIGRKLIDKVAGWAAQGTSSGQPAPVRVEHIAIRNANIRLPEFRLNHVDVELDLTPEGGLSRAVIVADQEQVRATLVPAARQFALTLSARNWPLPAGPPFLLTALEAKGTLGPDGLVLPSIRATLYDGTVTGKLALGWKSDWTIGGLFQVKQVEVQPVVALFTRDTTISGRLSANPVIDMRAPSASQLADLINVETEFRVENGVLYKVDLSAAPRALLNKDAIKGGETRFNQFSGYLRVDQFGYQLSNLKISSGALSAVGHLLISPKQELAGRIEASVKGTGSLISTPLAVSGTVDDPVLRPTTGSLAGAAAGTALLGPGFGTAIGLKAAQLTERLFGSKPGKKSEAARAAPPLDPVTQSKQPAEVPAGQPQVSKPAASEPPKKQRSPMVNDSRR